MRRIGRAARRSEGDSGSFWLSFSDLMSGLLLVFVLIMFYSVYQYFDMLEIKTAELLRQSDALSQKDAILTQQSAELSQAQEKLTASETALLAEQAKLLLRDSELADLGTALEAQKAELDAAKSLMSEQEKELLAAQVLLADKETLLATQQSLLASQQAQLDDLVGVRRRIVASLAEALAKADVRAAVDPQSGAITLDSSILFDRSEFSLSAAGKETIDRFFPVYLQVLLSEEYRGNIAELIIEGHTDSVGSYMANLELSQSRALAVLRYILSSEYKGITNETKDYLRTIVTANGRSESQLIYNADGTENADASRRVEFKFRLQDEQMIGQMADLLEAFDRENTALLAGQENASENAQEGAQENAQTEGGMAQ